MQSHRRGLCFNRHGKMLLAAADSADVRHLPVKASLFKQSLHNTHRLPQRQIKEASDSQAKLNRQLAVLRVMASLATSTTVPAHVHVQPEEQRTTRFQRRVVVFPVGRSVLRFY